MGTIETEVLTQQEEETTNTTTPTTQEGQAEEVAKDEPSLEKSPEQAVEEQVKTTAQANESLKNELTEKNVDVDSLLNEIKTTGTLSPKSYENLEKAGYPKALVDSYLQGQQAMNAQFTNVVHGYAGGTEEYNNITKAIQAKGNEAVESYNSLIESGNLQAIKMYIAGVKSELVARNGTSNHTVLGGQSIGGQQGYADTSEMQKAMLDPRYGVNEAYTQAVQTKLSNSTFISWNK